MTVFNEKRLEMRTFEQTDLINMRTTDDWRPNVTTFAMQIENSKHTIHIMFISGIFSQPLPPPPLLDSWKMETFQRRMSKFTLSKFLKKMLNYFPFNFEILASMIHDASCIMHAKAQRAMLNAKLMAQHKCFASQENQISLSQNSNSSENSDRASL